MLLHPEKLFLLAPSVSSHFCEPAYKADSYKKNPKVIVGRWTCVSSLWMNPLVYLITFTLVSPRYVILNPPFCARSSFELALTCIFIAKTITTHSCIATTIQTTKQVYSLQENCLLWLTHLLLFVPFDSRSWQCRQTNSSYRWNPKLINAQKI